MDGIGILYLLIERIYIDADTCSVLGISYFVCTNLRGFEGGRHLQISKDAIVAILTFFQKQWKDVQMRAGNVQPSQNPDQRRGTDMFENKYALKARIILGFTMPVVTSKRSLATSVVMMVWIWFKPTAGTALLTVSRWRKNKAVSSGHTIMAGKEPGWLTPVTGCFELLLRPVCRARDPEE